MAIKTLNWLHYVRVKGKFLFNRTVEGKSLQTARLTETQSRKKLKTAKKYDNGCIRFGFFGDWGCQCTKLHPTKSIRTNDSFISGLVKKVGKPRTKTKLLGSQFGQETMISLLPYDDLEKKRNKKKHLADLNMFHFSKLDSADER